MEGRGAAGILPCLPGASRYLPSLIPALAGTRLVCVDGFYDGGTGVASTA